MSRRTLPLSFFNWDTEDKKNVSILVKVNINNRGYNFLLDTGASLSMFDYNTVCRDSELKKLITPTDKEEHTIQGVGGIVTAPQNLLQTKGIISRSKPIDLKLYLCDLNVDSDIYVGILGFDFLMTHKVIIDLNNFKASFSDS